MTEQSTDYDSPWKEIIELYFDKFLEFFFPLAYSEYVGKISDSYSGLLTG